MSQEMTPEQNIILIASDVAEVKQMVEELGADFGEIKILVVGSGKEPGLFEMYRGLATRLDSHITAEKEFHLAEKKEREALTHKLAEYHNTEVRKAVLKGTAGSGGVLGALLIIIEVVLRPFWEKWVR